MTLEFYLKRNKTTLTDFIKHNRIKSYDELLIKINAIGLEALNTEKLQNEFTKTDVEERATSASNSQKKRVPNKKSKKPKSNDSSSVRRSKSGQRLRKSATK